MVGAKPAPISETHASVENIISAAAAIVDGEIIKADTWYTVRGGKFVEAEEA